MRISSLLLFLSIIFLPHQVKSQTEFVNIDVKKQDEEKKFGPNKNYFIYSHIRLGFIADNSGQMRLSSIPRSFLLSYSMSFKKKISEPISFIYSSGVNYSNLYAKWMSPPFFPFHKERYKRVDWRNELMLRLNFRKHGNNHDYFLGFGMYYDYGLDRRYLTETLSNSTGLTKSVHLDYSPLARDAYGLVANLGVNKLGFFINYRLTNMFKTTSSSVVNISRIQFGIELKR